MTDDKTATELLPCPICGGEMSIALHSNEFDEYWWTVQRGHDDATACKCRMFMESDAKFCVDDDESAWEMPWPLELRKRLVEKWNTRTPEQAVAVTLGGGEAKQLLLRAFGLAQMMHDCWIEECKAGDNVDISACNAYSYEFDQVAQAMFDMGIDPNDSDYYKSDTLGSGECESRWDELFGTPEKAARTLEAMELDPSSWCNDHDGRHSNCGMCPYENNYYGCYREDGFSMLEWLRGKAVKR